MNKRVSSELDLAKSAIGRWVGMAKLYTYLLPIDDGAAPNPFWGVCTLVICKPAIRRTAAVGDWIVGLGAKHTWTNNRRGTNLRCRVIYAMRVTNKMPMDDYDDYVKASLPEKCPEWGSQDHRRRLGDSIYDFSVTDPKHPRLRDSVHTEANRARDLSGKCALLSDHFYYFGNKSVQLPEHLRVIVPKQQETRSKTNGPYFTTFVRWIEGSGFSHGIANGAQPILDVFQSVEVMRWCKRHGEEKRDGCVTHCSSGGRGTTTAVWTHPVCAATPPPRP